MSSLSIRIPLAMASAIFTCAAAASPAPVDAPRFVQMGDLGVDVTLRYQLEPPAHPGAEGDPGPFLRDGLVAITAGSRRTRNVYSLASLGALAPNLPQGIPTGSRDGCGANGPLAIEKLAGSAYPVVVVMTVIIVKGCLPVPHVFVPRSAASAAYQPAARFTVIHQLRTFLGERIVVRHLDRILHVTRVRGIVLPDPPVSVDFGIRNWNVAVVDGRDGHGKPLTIAVDRPNADETPAVGETLSLSDTETVDVASTIRLSSEHEERYRRLHPQPPALPPGSR